MTRPFRATYRLQLGPHLDLAGARSLVPYLGGLGVSHLYLSPSFAAREGSTHGYDVVDPTRLADEAGFRGLVDAAHAAGLGVLLDIVPNHMAVDDANPYWPDPRFFDIDEATGGHRRFFDIDHLAGVRQEDPAVFEETHRLALSLVRDGLVDGLRIDHVDGVADPAGYLGRLRAAGVEHVWVEKILHPGERLRDWPVEGTVGYEFLNDVAALFVDPAAEGPLTALWEEISGDRRSFAEVAAEAKVEQVRTTFQPEVERLRREMPDVSAETLAAALASLPIYRTYVEPWSGRVEEADRAAVAGLPDPIARALLLEEPGHDAFVTRFQQTTPAVVAKGVEDTAFYRYARLLALNDVGGDPGRFGINVEQFHAANAARSPRNLLITHTHDTKRSGDVRARILALTALPEEWATHVRRWREVNAPLHAPDPVEEYLIYQTLVGAWPIEPDRLCAFVEKALREAKRTTSWVAPDHAHEARAKAFCRALYDHASFLADFEPFAARVAQIGDAIALRQLLLQLTAPGIPDIYQGDELTCLSLVDPDNRRPVDWARRRADTVHPKLRLIRAALALRARRPEAFAGAYEPVDAGEHVCAYLRGGTVLAAAAVRPDARVHPPPGRWREVLIDDEHGLALVERAD